MLKIQKELIPQKIAGVSSEVEHHAIAAKLKAMSDEWDKTEAETGKRPKEAFDYSLGLLNGREIIFSAVSRDIEVLKAKILDARSVIKWQ